jgi:hypothetical protein
MAKHDRFEQAREGQLALTADAAAISIAALLIQPDTGCAE